MPTPSPQLDSQVLQHYRRIGDPIADPLVESLYRNGEREKVNQLLGKLMGNSQIPSSELPSEISAYIHETGRLPDWAEPARIDRAQTYFMEHGPRCLAALACASLPYCYVHRVEAKILGATRRLSSSFATRRIYETAQFLIDVMAPGGLSPDDPESRGIRTTQKVRLMHASMRFLLREPTDSAQSDSFADELRRTPWNEQELGAPICQTDMAYTLQTFSYAVLSGLQDLGDVPNAQEKEDFIHCWNVVGHILGIHQDLLPDSFREAEVLFHTILGEFQESTEDGTALTKAVLDFVSEAVDKNSFNSLSFGIESRLPRLVVRALVPDGVADDLGVTELTRVDRLLSYFMLRVLRKFSQKIDKLQNRKEALGFIRLSFGESLTRHFAEYRNDEKRASFHIPASLRAQWNV